MFGIQLLKDPHAIVVTIIEVNIKKMICTNLNNGAPDIDVDNPGL